MGAHTQPGDDSRQAIERLREEVRLLRARLELANLKIGMLETFIQQQNSSSAPDSNDIYPAPPPD